MLYDENPNRKYPYRYRFPFYQIDRKKLKIFLSKISEVISHKNFTHRCIFTNHKNLITTMYLDFFFKNQEDSFIFKLSFADEVYTVKDIENIFYYAPYIPLLVTSAFDNDGEILLKSFDSKNCLK